MILVSNRTAVRQVVRAAAEDTPGLPALTVIDTIPTVEQCYANTLLIIDLAASHVRGQFVDLARTWRARYPQWTPIVLLPWLEPKAEVGLALALAVDGPFRSLLAPMDRDLAAWRDLMWHTSLHGLSKQLWHRLQERCPGLLEPNRVLGVLQAAPRVTNVEAYCRYAGIERRQHQRTLRQHSQRQTKDLLIAFRWLWAVTLREQGWRAGQVACALGYGDSSAAAKALFRTVPVGLQTFIRAGSDTILDAYAAFLVRHTDTRSSLPALAVIADHIARQ